MRPNSKPCGVSNNVKSPSGNKIGLYSAKSTPTVSKSYDQHARKGADVSNNKSPTHKYLVSSRPRVNPAIKTPQRTPARQENSFNVISKHSSTKAKKPIFKAF